MSVISVRDVRAAFDGVEVLHGVDLDVPDGKVVALLGPSGCGKTTLLRAIAGLERPVDGTIRVGDRVLSDGGKTRSHVPPEKRRIGMVFQDWALFPHMTVAENVGYGLPRPERAGPRVTAALDLVGLGDFADRAPGTLSGGQQQRVALARALAPEPKALLLDEPFSNLDTALRAKVRTEVHELLHRVGITTVFVTHDQDEAFVLGDQVAVMRDGLIVQQGKPSVVYANPASAWVAQFVGDANLVPGIADGDRAVTAVGSIPLRDPMHGSVHVLLRPEDLRITDAEGDAEVSLAEFYGHDTVYEVVLRDGTRVRVRDVAAPRFDRGARVQVFAHGAKANAFQQPVTDDLSTSR